MLEVLIPWLVGIVLITVVACVGVGIMYWLATD